MYPDQHNLNQSPEQPHPPSSRNKWLIVAVIGAAIFGLLGIAGAIVAATQLTEATQAAGSPTSVATSTEAAEPETVTNPEPEPEPVTFGPDDFKMKVKTLSKECFGSSGCLIEYRVIPSYLGLQRDLETASVEITYKVTGGSDGPQINTFSVENGEYNVYDLEGYTEISGSGKLKVKITEVVTF